MAYSADSFVADEQPTTAKWNKLWSNDASFNDGSGIGDDTIDSRHYVAGSIDPEHLADNVYGWEELADVTPSAGSIDTGTFTAKKNLILFIKVVSSGGTVSHRIRFNADTGSNYASKYSVDLGAYTNSASDSSIIFGTTIADSGGFGVMNIANETAIEKNCTYFGTTNSSTGAANTPTSVITEGKWANTSAQITRIQFFNTGTGTYGTGTRLIVLGHD